jgi:hypothetical protein
VLESRCDLALNVEGSSVRTVALAEIAAAGQWIANWAHMLPVISSTRNLRPQGMARAILDRVLDPRSLASLEREASCGDPSLVRGTIFELLRLGQLRAPSLHVQPLSHHTLVEPVEPTCQPAPRNATEPSR